MRQTRLGRDFHRLFTNRTVGRGESGATLPAAAKGGMRQKCGIHRQRVPFLEICRLNGFPQRTWLQPCASEQIALVPPQFSSERGPVRSSRSPRPSSLSPRPMLSRRKHLDIPVSFRELYLFICPGSSSARQKTSRIGYN